MSGHAVAPSPLLSGLFGKTRRYGDFLRRGFRSDAVAALDAWCEPGMGRLERSWDTANLPVWRFWSGPGVFGGSSLIGLVSASEDGVGRRYPLVVGLSQPPQILVSPPLETDALSRRLDHAEAIVRKLIEEDLSADEAMQIAELDAPDLVCAPSTTNSLAPASSIWWLDAARWTSLRGPPDTGDFLRMTAVWYDTAQTCPETGTLPTCLTETVDRP